MKEEKNITFRNYVILAVVLILSIAVVIYFYMWYGEIEESKLASPIMSDYLNVINYNELDDYLVENKDVIIYVSVLDNEETRMFEKRFKKIVNDYSLSNSMLYLNLTEENKKILNIFKEKYNIISLPCIIIFNNGSVVDVYNIANNDYDLELLVSYLRIEGIIND